MLELLTAGVIMGLSAGFTPGPLLTLLISETLRHGIRSGIKVAIAPILTDLPIIALTFFLSTKLGDASTILGLISLAGGSFVLWMGIKGLKTSAVEIKLVPESPRSLTKGIVTNVLSPYPYIFWLTVGTPILNKAMQSSMSWAVLFIVSFYICIVGAKLLLAVLAGHSRSFLKGKVYLYTMRLLGLALCFFALILFRDGLQLTGML